MRKEIDISNEFFIVQFAFLFFIYSSIFKNIEVSESHICKDLFASLTVLVGIEIGNQRDAD